MRQFTRIIMTSLNVLLLRQIFSQIVYTDTKKIDFISFQNEWNTNVVTVLLKILNQMELHLVQNGKENCHHDQIPFNLKGDGNSVFRVRSRFRTSGTLIRATNSFSGLHFILFF